MNPIAYFFLGPPGLGLGFGFGDADLPGIGMFGDIDIQHLSLKTVRTMTTSRPDHVVGRRACSEGSVRRQRHGVVPTTNARPSVASGACTISVAQPTYTRSVHQSCPTGY